MDFVAGMELGVLKKCRICGESKPATLDYFYRNAGHSDNLDARCITCMCAYQKRLNQDPNFRRKQRSYNRRYRRAWRQALLEEKETKISNFLRLLQVNEAVEVIERKTAERNGRTTLVRVLYPSGEIRTIYFSWKGNQMWRKESGGQSKAEQALAKSLQKARPQSGGNA